MEFAPLDGSIAVGHHYREAAHQLPSKPKGQQNLRLRPVPPGHNAATFDCMKRPCHGLDRRACPTGALTGVPWSFTQARTIALADGLPPSRPPPPVFACEMEAQLAFDGDL